jgi:hypothetical protein
VNCKIQWPHRKSKLWPSCLQHSASINDTTSAPNLQSKFTNCIWKLPLTQSANLTECHMSNEALVLLKRFICIFVLKSFCCVNMLLLVLWWRHVMFLLFEVNMWLGPKFSRWLCTVNFSRPIGCVSIDSACDITETVSVPIIRWCDGCRGRTLYTRHIDPWWWARI